MLFYIADYFITFNYTDALERIYGVPRNHILYMHGNLNNVHVPRTNSDVHKVLQYGNPNLDISFISIRLSQAFVESDLAYQYQLCVEEMKYFFSLFTKNFKSNFEKLKLFIDGKDIEEVVIMGRSYLGVDKLYCDEILIPIYSAVKWAIYFHENASDAEEYFWQYRLNGMAKNSEMCFSIRLFLKKYDSRLIVDRKSIIEKSTMG